MPSPIPKVTYGFGRFTLDVRRRALSGDGRDIPLTPKEFTTLLLLVESAGEAVEREELIRNIWPDAVVGDTSLARNISALRRHLGAAAIEVVPKFGYRFALPVTIVSAQLELTPVPTAEGAVPHLAAAAPQQVLAPAKRGFGEWSILAIFAAAVVCCAAAAVVLRGVNPVSADVRLAQPETWTDPQTGMTWTTRDNGRDVDRQQAIDYCRNLNWEGHRDWQLPAIDELQTLYDTSISLPGVWGPVRPVYWHVKGNLHLTGGESASNLEGETGQEQSYDFSFGRRNYDSDGFHADHRALCMRR